MSNDDAGAFWGAKSRPYLIGYGKPPAHRQFRKGKSGNPKGRPRKKDPAPTRDRSMRDEELAFMEREIAVQKAGKLEKLSMREAMRQKQAALAMGGNPLALKHMLERDERNRKDLAAEQAEDRQFWRDYISKYEAITGAAAKSGKPISGDWFHPEDLVFSEHGFVYNKYGTTSEEAAKTLTHFSSLRDFALLHSEWERRQSPAERPISCAELLAIVINDFYLPKRMRLSEDEIFFRMHELSVLKTRKLMLQIESARTSLGAGRCPWKVTGPAKLVLGL